MIKILLTSILVITGCTKTQRPVMTTTYRTLDYTTVQQHTAVTVLQRLDFNIKRADNSSVVSEKLRHLTRNYGDYNLWVVVDLVKKHIQVFCEPYDLCKSEDGKVNSEFVKTMLETALNDTEYI